MKIYCWGYPERIPSLCGETEEHDNLLLQFYNTFPPPSRESWTVLTLKPRKGKITEKKIGDFPYTSSLLHLVSQRALDALGYLLQPNGVLYPVVIKDIEDRYFIYRCTNVVDCLNIERSKIRYADYTEIKPPPCVGVYKHVWREHNVGSNEIFVIPQKPTNIYVTDSFVEKVRAARLKKFVYSNESINVTESEMT